MEISVIVPVYNKEKYISRMLGDISNQSFEDFECIIVDDGSTDSSGEICDEFAAKDKRFCVQHVPNGGVSRARNIGLTRATGQYVTFIDADDHIEPDYLMQLYTDIESSRADMVVAGLEKFWEDGHPPFTTEVPYDGVRSIKQLMPEFAQVQKRTGIYGYGCGKLIRRDLIANVRFQNGFDWRKTLSSIFASIPKLRPFILRHPASIITFRKQITHRRSLIVGRLITLRSSKSTCPTGNFFGTPDTMTETIENCGRFGIQLRFFSIFIACEKRYRKG